MPCEWALMAIRGRFLLRCCLVDVEVFRWALIEVVVFAEDKVDLMTSRMSGGKEPIDINVIK